MTNNNKHKQQDLSFLLFIHSFSAPKKESQWSMGPNLIQGNFQTLGRPS